MLISSPKILALIATDQRKKLKLSQADVGNRVGLRQQTISDFENNPDGTRLDTLFRILSAINLDINLSDKGTPESPTTIESEGW